MLQDDRWEAEDTDYQKFCTDCSPLFGHNTKSTDPDAPVKRKGAYGTWSEELKLIHKARVYRRGLERKIKLVEMKGGACQLCGYDRKLRCLSFHHRDPAEKKFSLTLLDLWTRPFEDSIEEAKKCDLLCLNCHGEIEDKKDGKYKKILKEHFGVVSEWLD